MPTLSTPSNDSQQLIAAVKAKAPKIEAFTVASPNDHQAVFIAPNGEALKCAWASRKDGRKLEVVITTLKHRKAPMPALCPIGALSDYLANKG